MMWRLFLVDSPIREALDKWRKDRHAAQLRMLAFAQARGSDGFFNDIGGRLSALTVPPKVWPGWRRDNSDRDRVIPRKKGEDGLRELEAMRAVERAPTEYDIAKLIGLPLGFEWTGRGGASGVQSWAAGAAKPLQVAWAGGNYCLAVPNHEAIWARHAAHHRGAALRDPLWSPPECLHPITQAKWEFLVAAEKVRLEDQEIAKRQAAQPAEAVPA